MDAEHKVEVNEIEQKITKERLANQTTKNRLMKDLQEQRQLVQKLKIASNPRNAKGKGPELLVAHK